jgi:hypothetical protein
LAAFLFCTIHLNVREEVEEHSGVQNFGNMKKFTLTNNGYFVDKYMG